MVVTLVMSRRNCTVSSVSFNGAQEGEMEKAAGNERNSVRDSSLHFPATRYAHNCSILPRTNPGPLGCCNIQNIFSHKHFNFILCWIWYLSSWKKAIKRNTYLYTIFGVSEWCTLLPINSVWNVVSDITSVDSTTKLGTVKSCKQHWWHDHNIYWGVELGQDTEDNTPALLEWDGIFAPNWGARWRLIQCRMCFQSLHWIGSPDLHDP